jgi:TonB family protein
MDLITPDAMDSSNGATAKPYHKGIVGDRELLLRERTLLFDFRRRLRRVQRCAVMSKFAMTDTVRYQMPDLLTPPDRSARPTRSLAGTGLSILLHGIAIAGVVSLMRVNASLPRVQSARSVFMLRSIMPVELRTPRAPLPAPRLLAPPPEPSLAVRAVAPLIEHETPIPAAPVARPIARAPHPSPSLVEPAPRPVVVGAFDDGAARHESTRTPHEVRSAGFDAAPARAPAIRIASARVGAFDASAGAAVPRPGTDRPSRVSVGGFGEATDALPSVPAAARGVASAGFAGPPAAAQPSPLQAQVRAAGFDAQQAAPATALKPEPVRRIDTPVEVLFKPTPDYTDEARALRIEGEVVLDVQFTADGQVHVLRSVRGLGHGLDEAAMRAAERIRFKPALSGGRPADVRTTVHIVFRLT